MKTTSVIKINKKWNGKWNIVKKSIFHFIFNKTLNGLKNYVSKTRFILKNGTENGMVNGRENGTQFKFTVSLSQENLIENSIWCQLM